MWIVTFNIIKSPCFFQCLFNINLTFSDIKLWPLPLSLHLPGTTLPICEISLLCITYEWDFALLGVCCLVFRERFVFFNLFPSYYLFPITLVTLPSWHTICLLIGQILKLDSNLFYILFFIPRIIIWSYTLHSELITIRQPVSLSFLPYTLPLFLTFFSYNVQIQNTILPLRPSFSLSFTNKYVCVCRSVSLPNPHFGYPNLFSNRFYRKAHDSIFRVLLSIVFLRILYLKIRI